MGLAFANVVKLKLSVAKMNLDELSSREKLTIIFNKTISERVGFGLSLFIEDC